MYHFFRVIQYFIGYVSGEDIKTHLDIHFCACLPPGESSYTSSAFFLFLVSQGQLTPTLAKAAIIKLTANLSRFSSSNARVVWWHHFFNNLWWFSVLPVMSPEPPKRHGATNEIYAHPPLSVSWLSVAFILVLPSPSLFHRIMHFGVLFNPLKLLMSHSKVTHFQYSHQNECVPPPYFYTTRNIMETYRSPASCPTKP